eukprot:GEZU01021235.1.p1 GENE.GEZU01021235.1~~GEZU01021235.1.p1  ORF type:complete len:251 (-),score=40.75 GEZU01021235.1:83-835(-)
MDQETYLARVRDLERREAQLAQREATISTDGVVLEKKKNWPRCRPLVYHNIADEVQEGRKRNIVRAAYTGWLIFCCIMCLNFIAALITIFCPTRQSVGSKAKLVIVSFIMIFIASPLHFLLSYWPLYQLGKDPKPGRYGFFFVLYFCNILYTVFMLAGYSDFGAVGIYLTIKVSHNLVALCVSLIMTFFWLGMVIYFLVIYFAVVREFRQDRGTLKVIGNAMVSEAGEQAKKAGRAGVRTAMTIQEAPEI